MRALDGQEQPVMTRHHGRIRRHGFAVALAGTLSLALTGCRSPLQLDQAVVVPPAGGAPAALYFTLRNTGGSLDTLLAIEVEAVERTAMQTVQPHRPLAGGTEHEPGPLMMPLEAVPIPAGGEVRFAPGGYTGALLEVRRPLVPGDSLRATLHFSSGQSATVVAPILAYADIDMMLARMPAGMLHHPEDGTHAASVYAGHQLYLTNGCTSCHGPEGEGDGPVGRTLSPRPRDFRRDEAFRNGRDVAAIAQTLATGIPGGGAMPLYPHLTHLERLSLAQYVLSLRDQPLDRNPQP